MHACVRACMHACMHTCMHACMHYYYHYYYYDYYYYYYYYCSSSYYYYYDHYYHYHYHYHYHYGLDSRRHGCAHVSLGKECEALGRKDEVGSSRQQQLLQLRGQAANNYYKAAESCNLPRSANANQHALVVPRLPLSWRHGKTLSVQLDQPAWFVSV